MHKIIIISKSVYRMISHMLAAQEYVSVSAIDNVKSFIVTYRHKTGIFFSDLNANRRRHLVAACN